MGAPPLLSAGQPRVHRTGPCFPPISAESARPDRFPSASPSGRFGWRFAPDHIALVALAELDKLRRALDHHCATQSCADVIAMTDDDIGSIDNLLSAPSSGGMGMGDAAWHALSKARGGIDVALQSAKEDLISADDLVEFRQRQSLAVAAMLHRHFEEMGQ